jgi:phytoene dehydrogenase-like protein
MSRSNSYDYDVVVIGAGHNGLTAAAYLARAGLRVVVLEASPTSGGMLGTNAIFDNAPKHLINEGGIQASLFRSSTVEADLDLKHHGLRQIIADPFHVHLDPDGSSLAFWKDPARTADELNYFSRKDARAYLEFAQQLDAAMDLALPFMHGHPTHPSGKSILNAIPVALRRRKDLLPLTSFLTRSHAEIITERFDTPLLRAALASMPPFCWMTQDGTGWALIYIAMCLRTNSSRMAGGSGALPAAIQRSFEAHAGKVRLSARVEELLLDGGQISGVRLASGEVVRAPYVLASCSPKLTLCELLPRGVLDDTMQRRADAIPVDVVEAATLKIDVALDGQLTLPRHQAWREDGLDLRKPIVAWQTFEDHIRAWDHPYCTGSQPGSGRQGHVLVLVGYHAGASRRAMGGRPRQDRRPRVERSRRLLQGPGLDDHRTAGVQHPGHRDAFQRARRQCLPRRPRRHAVRAASARNGFR